MTPTVKATLLIMEMTLTTPIPLPINAFPPDLRPEITQEQPKDTEEKRYTKYHEYVDIWAEMERDEQEFAAYIERSMKNETYSDRDPYIANRVLRLMEKDMLDIDRIFMEMDEQARIQNAK